MNAPLAQAESSGAKEGTPLWPWVLLGLVVCLAAISRQSLWIDEALTAVKAAQRSLPDWWRVMLADKGSDLQMPLYMIYVWGFAKIFGVSEWALRAANIPWFIAGFTTFVAALPRPKATAAALVAGVCPFAWYYLDEARPYAMQLGASLMIFGAMYRLSHGTDSTAAGERFWVAAFSFGIVSLCGSSLLGMIWAGAAGLSALFLFPRRRLAELMCSHRLLCLLTGGALLAISGYYLWTLKAGARASAVGSTDAKNLVFIGYELLGFDGLGPGRLDIREGGLAAFLPFAKGLALHGVVTFDLLLLGGWDLCRRGSRKTLAGLALVLAAPVIILTGAGYAMHFRVLGRHFTPLLPVVLFVLCLGLIGRWRRRHWASKPLACGFVALSLTSCLSLRFASRHAKDDYRDAARLANAALKGGQTVWWSADREGAVYYQLPITTVPGEMGEVLWLMNPMPGALADLPSPEIILVSKPDVYDGQGVLAAYIERGGYFKLASFPAFMVWERKSGLAARRNWRAPGCNSSGPMPALIRIFD